MLSKEEKVIKEELRQLLVKESVRELFFKHNNKYPDTEKYVEDKVLRSFEKDILQILPFIYEKIIAEYANQDKWINVKDELPEIGEYVTCHNTEGCISTGRLLNNGFTMFFADGEKLAGDLNVTHWQPLPNPPKQ